MFFYYTILTKNRLFQQKIFNFLNIDRRYDKNHSNDFYKIYKIENFMNFNEKNIFIRIIKILVKNGVKIRGPKKPHFSENPVFDPLFCVFEFVLARIEGMTEKAIFVLNLINELFFCKKGHFSTVRYKKDVFFLHIFGVFPGLRPGIFCFLQKSVYFLKVDF